MTMAQKVPFELVALDGPAGGFTDSHDTAAALAAAIAAIAGLDRSRLLVFGGWESATRCAGTTMQMVGERLEHHRAVPGRRSAHGPGRRRASDPRTGRRRTAPGLGCRGPPAVVGWATGHLHEPPNNPQVGHGQHADHHAGAAEGEGRRRCRRPGCPYSRVEQPKQLRDTVLVKDLSPDEIARDIVAWMRGA